MKFVDITKTFHTVSRDGLRKIIAKFGCPVKFTAMVRQLLDGILARFQNDSEFYEPFLITNGENQGCLLASALFGLMFSAMLTNALRISGCLLYYLR